MDSKMSSNWISTLLFLCVLVLAQSGPGASAQRLDDQCFSRIGCMGNRISVNLTSEADLANECCLRSQGLSYYEIGLDECIECVVFGFLASTLKERERGSPYLVEIGYLKGSGPSFTVSINRLPGGTATTADYSFSPTTVIIPESEPQVAQIGVSFLVDLVAQENLETVQLQLNRTAGSFHAYGMFQDTITLQIQDSNRVTFSLTEDEYSSTEEARSILVRVEKDARLANPVSLLLSPYAIPEAIAARLPLPVRIPPDDIRSSPNQAKSSPPSRQDFSTDVITITFQADEDGLPTFVKDSQIQIMDDEINEAREFFVVVLSLSADNATDPDLITLPRRSCLCRIEDDDDMRIGFQNASYTFTEPQYEMEILNTVFLEKENGRLSEQTFLVTVETFSRTPNSRIRPAAFSTSYSYLEFDSSEISAIVELPPFEQTLDIPFYLFPDTLPEGTEAFQLTIFTTSIHGSPLFLPPVKLFNSTYIVILDNDPIQVGFEQNYTVDEDHELVEACLLVFNPPDDEYLIQSITLVVNTVEGSADNSDFTTINSTNLDVHITLNQSNRRACFTVSINNDAEFESQETFFLVLSLDPATSDQFSNTTLEISPSMTRVDIFDLTCTDLVPPLHGSLVYNTGSINIRPAGISTVTYNCDAGYIRNGNESRECQNDETWSGPDVVPTCEAVSCGSPPSIPNGSPDSMTVLIFGENVTYSCDLGYTIRHGASSIVCMADGTWSTIPNCLFVDCGRPPSLPNGSPEINNRTTFGVTVTYNCDKGHRLSSEFANVSCMANKQWSTPPTCIAVSCGSPPSISNGSPGIPTRTTFGGIVTYSCDDSYVLSNLESGNASCLATGRWMNIPSCIPDVNCGAPMQIGNGLPGTPTNTTFGGSVIYGCSAGYAISHLDVVTCSGSGTWETIPTCTAISCSPLPQPDNGNVRYSERLIRFGTIATYECDNRFSLNGTETRTCIKLSKTSELGLWNGSSPSCEALQCQALPDLENGIILYSSEASPNYDIETVATYVCSIDFILEGNSTLHCVSTNNAAEWDTHNETHACYRPASTPEAIIIGAVVGALIILMLLAIIIVTVVIVNCLTQQIETSQRARRVHCWRSHL